MIIIARYIDYSPIFHYPTSTLRINYVASRCEGKALKHIGPRLRKDVPLSYDDETDLLDDL
ncbi:hypothetical protein N7510_008131 [Penicillium lagena]|uniref:uncharacterized protein n=1 Tax=Penicillium lagena TaxID=94218 RepID=UPI002541F910|nr:uncharacterized protein N7510_008131 [Penicillium lagena]KAJ5611412.1 hypothetical protein N7510_008131 [Penicillium lagena]